MDNNQKKKSAHENSAIISGILKGMTYSAIADELNYSKSTIKKRIMKLYNSFKVATRYEFIMALFSEIIKENKKNSKKIEKEITEAKAMLKIILKEHKNKPRSSTKEIKKTIKN